MLAINSFKTTISKGHYFILIFVKHDTTRRDKVSWEFINTSNIQALSNMFIQTQSVT